MARQASPESRPAPKWFVDAKYGMFIHWGVYSVVGRGEQVMFREHMKPSEYRKLADQFRPTQFEPDQWMSIAKVAGMKYVSLTTKHHDGFCMWDSATTDFCSSKTGLKRDYVAEYVQAARRAGMKVGLYFSEADWSQPAYFAGPENDPKGWAKFVAFTKAQIRELCTKYGKIDIFWFDGVWPHTAKDWQAAAILKMIRTLQPGILINDRLGLAGDIATPEQSIPEQQFKPRRKWESCMTSTITHWGYSKGTAWKSDSQAIRELCKVVEVGGNLIYNVGPKPDGNLPTEFITLMADVSGWMTKNREAIFDTSETICDTTSFGLMTCSTKRNRVYLHVLNWHGGDLVFAGLKNKVTRAFLLASGKKLKFTQEGAHVTLPGLPAHAPDPRNTVIALDIVGRPRSHDWARERLWHEQYDGDAGAKRVAARLVGWSKS